MGLPEIGLRAIIETEAFKKGMALFNGGVDDMTSKTEKGAAKITDKLASIGGGMVKLGAGAAAAGIAAAGAAFTALGVMAYKAGETIDEAYDDIAISTGAVGDELEDLKKDFGKVFKGVPADAKTVSGAMGELNKRLGATGDSLTDLAKPLLEASRLMGGDATTDAKNLARAMAAWQVPVKEGPALLDKLFVASQKSGLAMADLTLAVTDSGPALQAMGFSMDESIALLATLEKAGLNGSTAMVGLRTATKKFADAGIPMRQGLADTIAAIMGAKDETAAFALGIDTFGTKAGPLLVTAIRAGKMNVDELTLALQGSEGAILATAAATDDWPQKWEKVKNAATLALAPIGLGLMDLVGKILEFLMPTFEKVAAFISETVVPAFDKWVEALGKIVSGDVQGGLEMLFGAEMTGKIMTWLDTAGKVVDALGGIASFFTTGYTGGIYTALINLFGMDTSQAQAITTTLGRIRDGFSEVKDRAAEAGDKVVEWWDKHVGPKFDEASDMLEVTIPEAVAAFKLAWDTGVIQPLSDTQAAYEEDAGPALSGVHNWLLTKLPEGAITFRRFWDEKVMGGLEAFVKFNEKDLNPALTRFTAQLEEDLPKALAEYGANYDRYLRKPLVELSKFWDESIRPLLTTLDELIRTTLAKAWELLGQAMDPVLKWFRELAGDDGPLAKTGKKAEDTGNIFKWLNEKILTPLTDGLPGLRDKLADVNTWLQNLKSSIENLHLPSWLTPGSPTPLEVGLLGIAVALGEVSAGFITGSAAVGVYTDAIVAMNRAAQKAMTGGMEFGPLAEHGRGYVAPTTTDEEVKPVAPDEHGRGYVAPDVIEEALTSTARIFQDTMWTFEEMMSHAGSWEPAPGYPGVDYGRGYVAPVIPDESLPRTPTTPLPSPSGGSGAASVTTYQIYIQEEASGVETIRNLVSLLEMGA